MPKIVVLVIVLVVLLGALFFLSTLPKEHPTRTIETSVAQGNAH
jgi:hypothetical protein